MRYAADAPAQRVVMPLDELAAVYHRPSGTTHLLASPAPELLDVLAEGEGDAPMLLARLAARFEIGDADAGIVALHLAELVDAGLVARR